MLRVWAALFIMLGALRSEANASEACVGRLNQLVDEWKSIAVPGDRGAQGEVPGASRARHEHTAREVEYMRSQIRLALQLCKENKEHEAMLRRDVVRAWLQLPDVRHPKDHRYSYERRSR